MPYIARKPLKWGKDHWIQPGEEVPVEPGRNYAIMLRVGEIEFSQKRGAKASAPPPPPPVVAEPVPPAETDEEEEEPDEGDEPEGE
jgi:hypothetical protein